MDIHERILDAEISQVVNAVKGGQYSKEELHEAFWYYLMKFANSNLKSIYEKNEENAKEYFLNLAMYNIYREASAQLA